MISLVLSYLGTAAGGAILKGVFALIEQWLTGGQEKENRLIDAAIKREESAHERFQKADNFTKHTRRLLALMLCGTYCGILCLWAIFPSVGVATLVEAGEAVSGETGIKLFGYSLIGFQDAPNLAERVITVTTGHLVFASSYVLTFILSAYFMPVGRK